MSWPGFRTKFCLESTLRYYVFLGIFVNILRSQSEQSSDIVAGGAGKGGGTEEVSASASLTSSSASSSSSPSSRSPFSWSTAVFFVSRGLGPATAGFLRTAAADFLALGPFDRGLLPAAGFLAAARFDRGVSARLL